MGAIASDISADISGLNASTKGISAGISAGISGSTYGIRFDNGGSFSSGASTIHGVDSTLTGSYQPIMLNGSDVRFGTSATERARITSGGDLCVQATSAVFNSTNRGNITIGGSASSMLFLGTGNGSGSYIFHEQTTAGMEVWNTANGYIRFATNATERARITAEGTLLVGKTSNDDTTAGFRYNATSYYLSLVRDGNPTLVLNRLSSDGGIQEFWRSGSVVGSISVTTTATAYNTSSDRRLKDNIAPAADAGSVIDAIEIVKHDWKAGGNTRYGVIAQDLHAVAPEAVKVGDDNEEVSDPWGVDYSKLVPMLIKEVQSLRKRVAELEAK